MTRKKQIPSDLPSPDPSARRKRPQRPPRGWYRRAAVIDVLEKNRHDFVNERLGKLAYGLIELDRAVEKLGPVGHVSLMVQLDQTLAWIDGFLFGIRTYPPAGSQPPAPAGAGAGGSEQAAPGQAPPDPA